jgi:hypothetical protein
VKKYDGQSCPAERLNGQRYVDSWLENLLISGSMNGVEMDQQNPLLIFPFCAFSQDLCGFLHIPLCNLFTFSYL